MTVLADRLIARIRAAGPMTIAEFMAACLGDPAHGYYMTQEPFGRGGDFVTAPEVSQMFGELIGAWAIATWQAMDRPARIVLAELGPGRGTLMADLLRAARLAPAFLAAAEVHLVETSPRLREAQAATLAGARATWHGRIEEIPAGPLLLLANEFFDALPIRQFVTTPEGVAERMVGLDGEGRLAFGLRPVLASSEPHPPQASLTAAPPPKRSYLPRKGGEEHMRPAPSSATTAPVTGPETVRQVPASPPAGEAGFPRFATQIDWKSGRGVATRPLVEPGAIVEFSPAGTAIMATIAARLARDGGAALVVDYGYAGPAAGDTLQAVRRHGYDDVLGHPGEADLTAHVDFAALAQAANEAGAVAWPLLTQGEFLARLGLAERSAALARGKDAKAAAAIAAAAERLAGPQAMGNLFKVLAVSAPGLRLPGFDP